MAQNPFISIFQAIFVMASMGCVMGVGIVVGVICGIFFALEGDDDKISAFLFTTSPFRDSSTVLRRTLMALL